MATTERNRITGFFVIGFLVGLITMWALVQSGKFKVGADVGLNSSEDELFKYCMEGKGYSDKNGNGDYDNSTEWPPDTNLESYNDDVDTCRIWATNTYYIYIGLKGR